MNEKATNQILSAVYNLLALNLIISWGFLIYDLVTKLPFLLIFSLADSPELPTPLIWPELLSIAGDIAAIVLMIKARKGINKHQDYAFCVVAIIVSSLLSTMIGALIGIIALLTFITKKARNEFNTTAKFINPTEKVEQEITDDLDPSKISSDIYG